MTRRRASRAATVLATLTAALDASFPNPEGGVSMPGVVCFDD